MWCICSGHHGISLDVRNIVGRVLGGTVAHLHVILGRCASFSVSTCSYHPLHIDPNVLGLRQI